MAIQVTSSLHAAVTLYVVPEGQSFGFLQSPAGCIMQRIPIDETNEVFGWMVFLDYGLDVGSSAVSVVPFESYEPRTKSGLPVVAGIIHIDDRVKVIVTTLFENGEYKLVNQSFHASFTNYQANQSNLYPVDLGIPPNFLVPPT